jgi:hypothetical protein
MAESARELQLKLSVKGDSKDASKAMAALATETEKVAQAATKAEKALKSMNAAAGGGGPGGAGGGGPGGAGGKPQLGAGGWPQNLGRTSAFDRPIPVIIMGPKPLQVTGVGGGGGPGGGPPGPKTPNPANDPNILSYLRYLAVPAAAYAAAHVLSGVVERAQDPYMTGAQNARATAFSIPGLGEAVRFHDAMTGRSAAMQDVMVNAAQQSAQTQVDTRISQFNLGYKPEQARLTAEASWYDRSSPALSSTASSRTVGSEQQYQLEMRTLPLRQEKLRTERELVGATAEREEKEALSARHLVEQKKALMDLGKAESEVRDKLARESRREMSEADRVARHGGIGVLGYVLHNTAERLGFASPSAAAAAPGAGYGTGPEYDRDLKHIQTLAEKARAAGEVYLASEGGAVESRKKEARAGGEAAKASAREQLLTEAERHETRAQYGLAAASGIGSLDPVHRTQGLWALRALKAGTNPYLLQQFLPDASAIAGEYVRKKVQEHAIRSPEYAAARAEGFIGDAAEDPFGEQDLARKARAAAGEKEFEIDKKTAGLFAKAGVDLGGIVAKVITDGLKAFRAEFEAKLRESKEPH